MILKLIWKKLSVFAAQILGTQDLYPVPLLLHFAQKQKLWSFTLSSASFCKCKKNASYALTVNTCKSRQSAEALGGFYKFPPSKWLIIVWWRFAIFWILFGSNCKLTQSCSSLRSLFNRRQAESNIKLAWILPRRGGGRRKPTYNLTSKIIPKSDKANL